jgi:ribosome-binding protein aMBF1 (putative translation factor)
MISAECKAARKLLGWSQRHVAAKLLLNSSVIGKFETRERLPWSLNLKDLRSRRRRIHATKREAQGEGADDRGRRFERVE